MKKYPSILPGFARIKGGNEKSKKVLCLALEKTNSVRQGWNHGRSGSGDPPPTKNPSDSSHPRDLSIVRTVKLSRMRA